MVLALNSWSLGIKTTNMYHEKVEPPACAVVVVLSFGFRSTPFDYFVLDDIC
jgi:hypothetical protein